MDAFQITLIITCLIVFVIVLYIAFILLFWKKEGEYDPDLTKP